MGLILIIRIIPPLVAHIYRTHSGSQVQGLSVSALGYSRAIKENRSLYNMLQDLKGLSPLRRH